ncbi:transcriptional regulator protein [Arthrobacter sp. Hiyo8]|nr:transcriptional regulator protein [Arthrobacter sp. Hiyo8]
MPARHSAVMPVPGGTAAGAADAEDRTRDRVLNAVLEHGPVSAAELGDMLGFTPQPSAVTWITSSAPGSLR